MVNNHIALIQRTIQPNAAHSVNAPFGPPGLAMTVGSPEPEKPLVEALNQQPPTLDVAAVCPKFIYTRHHVN
jgi:hypothetical protein